MIFDRFAAPSRALALGLVALIGVGCDGDSTEPATPDAGIDVSVADALPFQPTRRFPLGATFYLPGDGWQLAAAPDANGNTVYDGADGFARFTPIVAGDYRFERGDAAQSLTVVADVPYAHFNYYPTTSVHPVGDQVWVAHVFDPHISRLDAASGAVIDTVAVGPWPVSIAYNPGMSHALVAHKAGDTVGFVNAESGRLEDAVWVGDEPAQIVLSPDGSRAWVSLNSQDAVALLDVPNRALLATIETNLAPQAMALSEDGGRLFVASYRSGVSDRLQFGTDERYDIFDIAVVDTADRAVVDYIEAVGSNLNGLYIAGDRLYVAMTRSVVSVYSGQPGMTAFRHTVAAYDLAGDYAELAAADIGRQESSAGIAARPYGLTMAGGVLWAAVEGSDVVLGLDPETLAEVTRYDVPGRPRGIAAVGDTVFTHGLQAYSVTRADSAGTVLGSTDLSGDPRGASLALGQRLYTGTGGGAAEQHSCADCHIDGLTDGNVWSAGGFSESASRPMFWMQGSDPIGWEGDAFDLFSYLYGSPGPTIGVNVSTEAHRAFFDYLAAFVPPPPANGFTARDGSFTEEGLAGREAFEESGCLGCHSGPLTTTGLRLPGGGTQSEHPIVVPSLVGAYRHGSWLVNGAARTLLESVVAMEPLSGRTLDDEARARIVRYLKELTARQFFLLDSTPSGGQVGVSAESPLTLIFSHAVFDDAENLALIRLLDSDGEPVAVSARADNRAVTLEPAAPLDAGAGYTVEVGAGFESFSEKTVTGERRVPFTVVAPSALTLEGDYEIHIDHPNLDRETQSYDPSVIIPVQITISATPTGSGADVRATITDILDHGFEVTIADGMAYWPPFPFPVGPGFLNRSFPTTMALVDDDGDGVADGGEATMMFRSPGLEAKDVVWRLQRPAEEPEGCDSAEGEHPLLLDFDADGLPIASWEAEVNALSYSVTGPEAQVPLGPGPVTGGEVYWVLSATAFPAGFAGPISYGEVPDGAADSTEASGGMAGGGALPDGACIKLTVVFSDFSTSELRFEKGAQ